MKRYVACLVIVAFLSLILQPLAYFPTLAANQETISYKRGKEDGRRAANEDTEVLWSVVDFAYGFTLGPIAVAHSLVSSYVLEQKLTEELRRQISHRNRDYREGFKDGYFHAKDRNSLVIRGTGWIGWLGTWAVMDQMNE